MNLFDAYILGYGFCYIVSGFTKDFYLVRPNLPAYLVKTLLVVTGAFHVLAAIFGFSFLILPLAFIESYSCVAHWSGKIQWNGKLKDFNQVHGAYAFMALFDLVDITFLLSKLVIPF